MKFHELTIQNFMAITEATLDLADRGLVMIAGKNSADTSAISNGAGKSSIADALCWCWFGTTARGASGDDVINDDAGKNCIVTSVLQDGAITYTATRHRKHKTGKNTLQLTMNDGFKTTDLTKGTDKLTQEVATQVIGASLDVFVGSIYAGQERMPDLPAMTDKNLKVLIEEASGVLVLEEAYKTAMQRSRESAMLEDEVRRDVESLTEKLAYRLDDVENDKISVDDWTKENEEAVKALLIKASGEVTTNLKDAIAALAKIDDTVPTQIAQLEAKIKAVSHENDKRAELSRLAVAADNELQKTIMVRDRAKITLDTAEKNKISVASRVGQPCTECGRPLTADELDKAQEAADIQFQKHYDDFGLIEQEVARLTDAQVETAKELLDYESGMTDVAATVGELTRLNGVAAENEKVKTRRETAMQAALDIRKEIGDAQAEVNPYLERLEKRQHEAATIAADLERRKAALKKAEIDALTDKDVAKVFSPSGVRARILDEVTPFLNDQTAKYLHVLSDGNIFANWSTLTPGSKVGTFKEKFSIEVANATGGKNFKSISGGEKRKVRVATALALQDLVATRATKPIDLFIGDEIDDALDAAGVERLTMVLEEKAKERGSVFIISHNEIRDYVPNVIEIEKTPSGTVLRTIAA